MRIANILVAVVGVLALGGGIVAGGRYIDAAPSAVDSGELELDEISLDMTEEGAAQPDAAAVGDLMTSEPAAPADPATTVASVPEAAPKSDEILPPAATQLAAPAPSGAAPVGTAPENTASAGAAPSVPENLLEPQPLESVVVAPEASARAVSPSIIAPPALDATHLERIDPRKPLSQLSLALPPKPPAPEDWKGKPMMRPVATGSAQFEAMGYTIAIAGTESVGPDETCNYQGAEWNCGVRARTAFRLFLRGRAPSCVVPPEADRAVVVVSCKLVKQDVGAWLIENGWARAAEGGVYAEAGARAKAEGKGIYGPPPAALPAASSRSTTVAPADIVMPLDQSGEQPTDDTGFPAAPSVAPELTPAPSPAQ